MEKANHIQKIATPRYLLQTLEVMRVGQGDKETYLARDKFHGRVHSLEPWQFHVLKALPDCADFGQLNTDFEREFGQPLSQREFNEFIVDIANLGLLSQEAVAHPLLTRFASKTYAVEDGVAKRKPFTVIEGPVFCFMITGFNWHNLTNHNPGSALTFTKQVALNIFLT